MLNRDFVIKHNELCLLGREHAQQTQPEAGLYVRDTRFLSQLTIQLAGAPLTLLGVAQPAPDRIIITGTNGANGEAPREGPALPPHTVAVRITIAVAAAVAIRIDVENYTGAALETALDCVIGADFRDMFDIRGIVPDRRPVAQAASLTAATATLAAVASDGLRLETDVRWTAPAGAHPRPVADDTSAIDLLIPISLARGASTAADITITPQPPGAPLRAVAPGAADPRFHPGLTISTPDPAATAVLAQGDADLALLQTAFPVGVMPAAGIPWYIAPFGRDSLITALQTLWAYPERAADTLRVLASLQGTEYDAFREEQPGKILHEMRYGEMARTGQVPHGPYYGSIDATPLFVMAFARYDLWHHDDALYADLIGNVRRALAWIETDGDPDGDGFLEFAGTTQGQAHISQQGWKDSGDSLHFANGAAVTGPIALVEVQGYVHAAYAWLAAAVRRRGDTVWAEALAERAERLRERITAAYWLEPAGFYAQALDGRKRPVDAISSNAGHLLYCGVPDATRAGRVAARLAAPDLDSGWGIRTLSTEMATYNPLSYHNGTVWPHDTSLALAGLAAYGWRDQAVRLAQALIALATFDGERRLSELYCGFPREPGAVGPIPYPATCRPQAWAAGAGLLALQVIAGLDVDPATGALRAGATLPAAWPSLAIRGIRQGPRRFALHVDAAGTVLTPLADDPGHAAPVLT